MGCIRKEEKEFWTENGCVISNFLYKLKDNVAEFSLRHIIFFVFYFKQKFLSKFSGGYMILSSVIIAVIKLAGVTSNAGLYTFTPSGAVFVPDMQVTSS